MIEMTETMTSETIWFLNEMTAKSERDFADGKVYTHEQVKEMLKVRKHDNKVVTACL